MRQIRIVFQIIILAVLFLMISTSQKAYAAAPFNQGNSMHFADSNDMIGKVGPLTTNVDNITMETWVRADTLSSALHTRIMYNGDSSKSGYGIYLEGASKNVSILLGGKAFLMTSKSLNPGEWYHLAAVRDKGTWKLYVDGKEQTILNGATSSPTQAPTTEFSIGNSSYSSENFTGLIDEVRFWTVARTQQDISDNMYIKLTGNEQGLLAYYNFEQGVAGGDNRDITTITDSAAAGGNQNLTISGFALNGPTSNFVGSVQLGNFQFESNSYAIKENKGSVRVAITRTGGSEGSATINYYTADGTAAAGTNYTATSGSITFASGETRKEIDIPIINNNIDAIKSFTMSLSAQQGITISSGSTTINIDRNDSKVINAFNFAGLNPSVTGNIDENAKTITLNVPYDTDVTTLVPTITHTGASVSPNTGIPTNFANPVTYTVIARDGSRQYYTITVVKPTLDSIAITTPATKLAYWVGEALDISGLVVTGTYSDATTRVVSVNATDITGFDSSVAASQTLTITIGGKTVAYTVSVAREELSVQAPADILTEATGSVTSVSLETPTYTFAGLLPVTVTNDAPAAFPLGTTIVTWIAKGKSGITATATQKVTVVDTTKPVLTIPQDITVEASAVNTPVTIGEASAIDIFGATVTSNALSAYPVGITQVIWTAADANGNTATGIQKVNVVDTTAPEISIIPPVSKQYTTNDLVTLKYSATDRVTENPILAATLNGVVVENNKVISLASMAGKNTLEVTATDIAGNKSTKSVEFEVVIVSDVDIKPDSLNLKSNSDKNAVTAYIELAQGYDVSLIDISTVKLLVNGKTVNAQVEPAQIQDYDNDGKKELMVKFQRQQVISLLSSLKGNTIIELLGNLQDGKSFKGSDTIKVLN